MYPPWKPHTPYCHTLHFFFLGTGILEYHKDLLLICITCYIPAGFFYNSFWRNFQRRDFYQFRHLRCIWNNICLIITKIGVSRDRYLSVGHFDPPAPRLLNWPESPHWLGLSNLWDWKLISFFFFSRDSNYGIPREPFTHMHHLLYSWWVFSQLYLGQFLVLQFLPIQQLMGYMKQQLNQLVPKVQHYQVI